MKKSLFSFLILMSFALLPSVSYAVVNRCYKLFDITPNLAREPLTERQSERMMAPTRVDPNNTTSKRAEDKATLSKVVFEGIFEKFKTEMQRKVPHFSIVLRDALRPEMHNVTWTKYTNSFELNLPGGKKTTGVIRLRKYGWVPFSKEVKRENIEINPAYTSISGLEFKIRDPEFASDQFKSVLKPIVRIYDADAAKLLAGSLSTTEAQAVLNRTLTLNADANPQKDQINKTIVRQMLQAIAGLHAENNRLQLSFESLYKRSAYKIDVTDPRNNVKRDVQITVDERISTFVNEANSYSLLYNTAEPLVVVETKLPISFIADVVNPASSSMPEMAAGISQFINNLRQKALREFEVGKGKLGHTIREFADN
jgi:hypothetical protein